MKNPVRHIVITDSYKALCGMPFRRITQAKSDAPLCKICDKIMSAGGIE